MQIPEKCLGCTVVEAIAEQPVKGFRERIKEATGKDVEAAGGHPARINHYGPDFVNLYPDGRATDAQISSAWYGAKAESRALGERLIEQVEDCPGLCEAHVTIPGVDEKAQIRVCGKIALSALNRDNAPQSARI